MIEPKVFPQLTAGPRGGIACGDMSIGMGLHIVSGGKVDFSDRLGDLIEQVRLRATPLRNPQGGTYPDEWKRAYESFVKPFERHGLRPPQMRILWSGSFDDDLVPALKKGRSALVAVWYPVIDRLAGWTGQRGLQAWHAVVVTNLRREKGERVVTMLDPLCDGRRREIAKGPQTVSLTLLRAAVGKQGKGSFAPVGEGRVIAGIFRPVKALDAPMPEPVPEPTPEPDPCAEQLAPVQELLAKAIARLGEIGDLADEPIDPEIADGTGLPDDLGDPHIVDPEEAG